MRLKENQILSQVAEVTNESSGNSSQSKSSTGAPKQTLLKPMIQGITAAKRVQLGRKFQLAILYVLQENLLNRMNFWRIRKKLS